MGKRTYTSHIDVAAELDDNDPIEEEYWYDPDPPPCEHCGAEYDQPHKYGCHLLKAIAEALWKEKTK